MELVHLQTKTDCTRKDIRESQIYKLRSRILKLKGVFIMMYKIEYGNGKCCNYAHSRADLLEWLRILRDEKIDDILKINKSGAITSVIEKYKKFLACSSVSLNSNVKLYFFIKSPFFRLFLLSSYEVE